MNKIVRINTLEFQFPRGKERPHQQTVLEWLAVTLKIPADKVECVQLDQFVWTVYVTFNTEQALEDLHSRLGDKVVFIAKTGEQSDVSVVRSDSKRQNVRVLSFPAHGDNNKIVDALKPYGNVEGIKDERWGNKHPFFPMSTTGVRIVTMVRNKHIPSVLEIQGHKVLIMYKDQPKTCGECNAEDHLRADCPSLKNKAEERMRRLQNNPYLNPENTNKPNYSDVVSGANQRQSNGNLFVPSFLERIESTQGNSNVLRINQAAGGQGAARGLEEPTDNLGESRPNQDPMVAQNPDGAEEGPTNEMNIINGEPASEVTISENVLENNKENEDVDMTEDSIQVDDEEMTDREENFNQQDPDRQDNLGKGKVSKHIPNILKKKGLAEDDKNLPPSKVIKTKNGSASANQNHM